MKKAALFFCGLSLIFGLALSAQEPVDPWEPLRMFAGHWSGHETGAAGVGLGEREYQFVIQDKYLHFKNNSSFEPQDKNPEGEVHEDWGFFSYDAMRDKIILRQFFSEGFINQYTLDSLAPDMKTKIFVTESIENVPEGFRSRYILKIKSTDEFTEFFELASPGYEFSPLLENHWTRVK